MKFILKNLPGHVNKKNIDNLTPLDICKNLNNLEGIELLEKYVVD
jgi:hypothetical protein